MDQATRERLSQAALCLIAVAIYMAKPWESTLQAMDSAIHARFALEVSRGFLLPALPIPHFFPDGPAPYFNDHPFLPFYLVGKFMRAFGANAWGARFLPSLFGVFNVALVMMLARKVASYRAAFFAGIFMLASPLVLQFTARFQLDPFLITFILLSFIFAIDRKFVWAGVASGLAVCFKSPVGWLILPTLFIFERFSLGFFKVLAPAIALPALMWGFANEVSHLPLLQDYFQRQVLGTAVGGRNLSQSSDWQTGFEVLRRNFKFPALLTLFFAVLYTRRERFKLQIANQAAFKLVLAGFLIFWFIISIMRFKFPHYFLPGIPLAAVILAALIPAKLENKFSWCEKPIWALGVLIPLALLILPIKTVPESFPALRYFTPVIQSEAKPGDSVFFVENEEPYGSAGDYYVETAFYTGLNFYSSQCSDAVERLRKFKPAWVMTSGAAPFTCLEGITQADYPSIWRFGNQYLLSTYPRLDPKILDFTPQVRDLTAPIDGAKSPLPQDIFYRFLEGQGVN